MTLTITPPESPSVSVEALLARVAELERTQLAEDVQGFVALFEQDAVWVTGGARRLIGRDTIAAFTREVLPGAFADGSVRYEVEHILFITPDLALTGVNQEYLSASGEPLAPRQEGRPSYLWRQDGGRWQIVSGQNTAVPV